ncbi:MAG: twin-arginine translocation signal domain-containing protein [bacterium]|nr:twin-arginine translocation signal domain-containing protein [bacterium]
MKLEKKGITRRGFLQKTGAAGVALTLPGPLKLLAMDESPGAVVRNDLGIKPSAGSATNFNFKMSDFAQVTDVHITDSTNPLRTEVLDSVPGLGASWRPQLYMGATTWDAVVRSINEQNKKTPLSFCISTGDQVDNGMANELEWFLNVANGSPMPDDYNDLVNTDDMTPVSPQGFDIPWYFSFGNHDTMIVGNFPAKLMKVVHKKMAKKYGFEINDTDAVMDQVGEHGFDLMPSAQDGYYSFTTNGYVHNIVLNTANDNWLEGVVDEFFSVKDKLVLKIFEKFPGAFGKIMNEINDKINEWIREKANDVVGGFAEGTVDDAQFDWMIREIEENQDKICVIYSHHSPDNFLSPLGNVTRWQFKKALCSHENVVAHVHGHTHQNMVNPVTDSNADYGYWSITSCSVTEYPQEWRHISVTDNGDGTGSLACRMRSHDYTESITVAKGDPQANTTKHYGDEDSRNVDLLFAIPEAVAGNIIENPPPEDILVENDTPDSEGDDSLFGDEHKCFIATAAFGTTLEPDVRVLRRFRDEKLKNNRPGRAFTRTYYRLSPPVAGFIASKPALKAVVRFMLKPLIAVARRLV